MKKLIFNIGVFATLSTLMLFPASCSEDLLDQKPTTEPLVEVFWKNENDAAAALMGAYSSVRPLFDRDYYFDGHGEYTRVRGTSATDGNLRLGDAYHNGNYNPSGYGSSFDKYFRYLYGGVNRTNYVIENTRKLLTTTSNAEVRKRLETIVGEARLLRGMVYFRLISMWGDVPYINKVVNDNDEVASIERTPIAVVKDSIMADFTYAFDKLPEKKPGIGRAGKPAALAFRGKLQLYWASWKRFGWPELEGFTQDDAAAVTAYTNAAADFKAVIDNYGLILFRGGTPGDMDRSGEPDTLPNYYHLFLPAANGDAEFIMNFAHGGTGTSQGEELMRDFSGRSHESSQCWVSPRYEIADRYQLTTTGEFAPKLVPMNPTTNAAARTTINSAVNPLSYANRDYRMKSSIQWDYEMSIGMASLQSTGFVPFIYNTWNQKVAINGVTYTTYNTDGSNSGYVFRKFVRNYAGQGRSDGDFAWPVMRLADVYLMYAEATNAVLGPQADAIDLVNKIRHRGNLPPLTAAMTASPEALFSAIEQERIIELVAEGHRGFDLRRWRALERVWGPPNGNGIQTRDTHGANRDVYYRNTVELTYQQNYIFRIPPGERDRNSNLTQNKPWL
ncbi:RagB/SusD family nutrient uptake outer membrane protein [Chryseosolibacter indicus]|uniref:RagB/SusD family nutrient uptake outer membrane protein n=1 Tax=Chryseosolibacter indicus TaxID=2782351 RepID=A0ABS5VSJ6_9BACT|nr:RagB/SusD family nutrient uptake outer membrane protein [Chryseosolibacter indicus]MBT1703777.1 RagB/SusD family nutrient uptake outer membrane protein [Chryseosolibacter indicus]